MTKTVRLVTLIPCLASLSLIYGAPMDNREKNVHGHNFFYVTPELPNSPPRELQLFPNDQVHEGQRNQFQNHDLATFYEHYPANNPHGHPSMSLWEHGQGSDNDGSTHDRMHVMQLGQGSNQHQGPRPGVEEDGPQLTLATNPRREPVISYYDRQHRPKMELMARSQKLKRFEWQQRYTESELYKIYHRIVQRWQSQPRWKMMNRDKRLHEILQQHPAYIDRILPDDGDEEVVNLFGTGSARKHVIKDEEQQQGDDERVDLMTTQQYLDFLWHSRYTFPKEPKDSKSAYKTRTAE